ncbi:MAG: hypothetical protein ACK5HT_19545, partial [Draconibacterium sp.]
MARQCNTCKVLPRTSGIIPNDTICLPRSRGKRPYQIQRHALAQVERRFSHISQTLTFLLRPITGMKQKSGLNIHPKNEKETGIT